MPTTSVSTILLQCWPGPHTWGNGKTPLCQAGVAHPIAADLLKGTLPDKGAQLAPDELGEIDGVAS